MPGFNPEEPQPQSSGAPQGGDWIGALIGAGTAVYTTVEAKKAQERQNKANLALADYQYGLNQKAWEAQNAYNSPLSQINRYKEAGLNPALMYGSGGSASAGNASQYPQYNAPRMEQEFSPITAALPQMLGAYQEFRMRQAQIDNVRAQTANVQTRTATEALRPGILNTKQQMDLEQLEQFKYLRPYQAAIVGGQARSSEAKTLQEWKRLSLMGQQEQSNVLQQQQQRANLTGTGLINELRAAEVIFKQYRNQWMKAGVTSSDSPLLRLFVRQLGEAGILDTFSGQMAQFRNQNRQK